MSIAFKSSSQVACLFPVGNSWKWEREEIVILKIPEWKLGKIQQELHP